MPYNLSAFLEDISFSLRGNSALMVKNSLHFIFHISSEKLHHYQICSRSGCSPTSFPGSFISPPQRERGKKDPGPGWSHVLVTNLSSREGFQFIKVLSPRPFVTSSEPALWATMESSFSISQRRFVISSTFLSTFETKLGLETMKR